MQSCFAGVGQPPPQGAVEVVCAESARTLPPPTDHPHHTCAHSSSPRFVLPLQDYVAGRYADIQLDAVTISGCGVTSSASSSSSEGTVSSKSVSGGKSGGRRKNRKGGPKPTEPPTEAPTPTSAPEASPTVAPAPAPAPAEA